MKLQRRQNFLLKNVFRFSKVKEFDTTDGSVWHYSLDKTHDILNFYTNHIQAFQVTGSILRRNHPHEVVNGFLQANETEN